MATFKRMMVSVIRWLFEIKAADGYDSLPASKAINYNYSAAEIGETPAVVKFDTGAYMLSRI